MTGVQDIRSWTNTHLLVLHVDSWQESWPKLTAALSHRSSRRLTYGVLMQRLPRLQAARAAFKSSNTEFLTPILLPKSSNLHTLRAARQLTEESVVFHRITPRICALGARLRFHPLVINIAWWFTYSELKWHGSLNPCHWYFSCYISRWILH